MEREGIDTLSYFQVDNPLVRAIDPAFIGWHLLRGSEMSSKMVPKAYAEEKLGHFCAQNGQLVVVEYSDLPMAMQRETDAHGQLRYVAGSIAIHLLDREFIRRMARSGCDGGVDALPSRRQEDSDHRRLRSAGETGKGERREVRTLRLRRAALRQEPARDRDPPRRRFFPGEERRWRRFSENLSRRPAPSVCALAQLHGAAIAADATGLPAINLEVAPSFGYDEDSFAEAWAKLGSPPVLADGVVLE